MHVELQSREVRERSRDNFADVQAGRVVNTVGWVREMYVASDGRFIRVNVEVLMTFGCR
jgi:hypothetical protein